MTKNTIETEAASPPDAPTDYQMELEPCKKRVRVIYRGVTVADTRRAVVVRETRLPPTYYLPREDVRMDLMTPSDYRTHCPFKGNASYWSLSVEGQVVENVLWSYENPLPEIEALAGWVSFFRNRMDAWYEEGDEVSIDPVTDTHEHGNPLVDWLMRDGWEAASIPELVSRLARQLQTVGVPVLRLTLMVRTLHPQVLGVLHVWQRKTDAVESFELPHEQADTEAFQTSPLLPIFEGQGGFRRRLVGPEARLDFPILKELHAEGATDYAALPITFSDGRIHALTLATDRPGGFTLESLGHLHEVLPLVSRLAEVHSLRRTARTLLDTYLGSHTGARVLEGRIRRGDGEEIPAVIWYCDLRDSTHLTETLTRERYLALLNRFYECTAGVVMAHGGEVLKFIGDAVLAIFPLRGSPKAAENALAATHETLTRVAELNQQRHHEGDPEVRFALALHHGEVTYGNVGVEGRLDFTVTGPAVNEISRLETLSKTLGTPVVASDAFARLIPDGLVSLGHHKLRGVRTAPEVFTLLGHPSSAKA